MVRRAGMTVFKTHSHPDNPNRQAVKHRSVTNKLECPQRRESSDRIRERYVSGLGEPSSHPNHILLRYAAVEKAIGEPVAEFFERHVTQIRRQQKDALVFGCNLRQSPDECSSQSALSP